jgi:hypothetical protein
MNAKDAYQNTLWNKLPYDLKKSIFVSTENGEFSVTLKISENDKKDVSEWISYLRSLDYEVFTNMFMPIQDEKYLLISWDHYGKREKTKTYI